MSLQRAIGVYQLAGGIAGIAAMLTLGVVEPAAVPWGNAWLATVPFGLVAMAGDRCLRGERRWLWITSGAQLIQVPQFILPWVIWKMSIGAYATYVLSPTGARAGVGVELALVSGRMGPGDVAQLGVNFVPIIVMALAIVAKRRSRATVPQPPNSP